jgi:hypothetical protein
MDSGAGWAGKSGWAALGVENKERKGGLVCRVSAQLQFGIKKFLFLKFLGPLQFTNLFELKTSLNFESLSTCYVN